MIVYEEMIIENFRRHTRAHFNFCTKEKNNLNIILANNGVGKSTLFDAFTWCFFDVEDHLKIDPKYHEESESLVNTQLFPKLSEGEKITTKVTLYLRDDNKRYKIERSIDNYKINGKRKTDEKSILKVQENDINGSSGWSSPIKASEHLLDQIIPKDLRQFFFFDGEQLREHFKGDTNSFLKEKIEEVSRVKYIKQCIEISEELDDLFNHKIAKLSDNIELTELADRIVILKKKEKEIKEKVDYLCKKYKQINSEKENKEKEYFLFGNIEAKELAEKQFKIIKDNLEDAKEKYKNTENKLKTLVLNSFQNLSIKKEILNTQTIIDTAVTNKEAPPPITRDYIERLLNVHKECICGTSLEEGTKCKETVKELLNNTEVAKSINFRRGQNFLDECSTDINNYSEHLQNIKGKIMDYKNNIIYLEEDLLEEKNKIKNFDNKKLKELKEELNGINSDLKSLIGEISYSKDKKEDIISDLKREEKKFDKLTYNNSKLKKINHKKEKLDSIIEEFKQLMDKIISKNKKELITKTEDYFRKTCTSKSFEKIRFKSDEKDNYELFIEDKDDQNINLLRTLSAGEAQIFAFSFAAALREVTKIQSPFIIDTPLGKIDPVYRDEVIRALPIIFKDTQTTLLVTESEYTERVKKEIIKSFENFFEYKIYRKFDETGVENDKNINLYLRMK
jgi:DNA sulfur modification protein DndD